MFQKLSPKIRSWVDDTVQTLVAKLQRSNVNGVANTLPHYFQKLHAGHLRLAILMTGYQLEALYIILPVNLSCMTKFWKFLTREAI